MAIKKQKSGKYLLDFRINGKDSQRIRKKFDKKIDAEVWLQKFEEKQKDFIGQNLPEVNPMEVTFAREAKFWEDNAVPEFAPGHKANCKTILAKVVPKFGALTLDQFNPTLLMNFQKEIRDEGRANSTTNHYTETIQAIIHYSIKHRRFPYDPTVGFEKLNPANVDTEFWFMEEAESFLSFIDVRYPAGSTERWKFLVIWLTINTGLRAGEVWGLKRSDLVPLMKMIVTRRQFNRVTREFTLTKSKKNSKSANISRQAPFHDELILEMEAHILQNGIGPDDILFQTKTGRPICHDNFVKRVFNKDVEEWGGKRIRFHDLRHTAGTLMAASGVDVVTLKGIKGHANVETTMKYLHLVGANVTKVANNFSISPSNLAKEKLRLVAE